jgi:hypothetical protein
MRIHHHIGRVLAGGLVACGLAAAATMSPGVASARTGSPAAAAATTVPRVTSVFFNGVSGGTTSPTITVLGSGFGTRPLGHPDTCGPYSGDYYGPNFYFWDDNSDWAAGLSSDCVGIVISSWTPTEIVFTFGSAYGPNADWTLRNGDAFAFRVRSFMRGGIVDGLS